MPMDSESTKQPIGASGAAKMGSKGLVCQLMRPKTTAMPNTMRMSTEKNELMRSTSMSPTRLTTVKQPTTKSFTTKVPSASRDSSWEV